MDPTEYMEFHELFERVLKAVDISDCKSPREVRQRILQRIERIENRSKSQNCDYKEDGGEL